GWALWRRRATISQALCFAAPLVLLAGPWYLRNLVLYRNLTATVVQTSSLSIGLVLKTATVVPWLKSSLYMAHSSLWTGNNSFTSFSARTLNVILALLAVSVVLYFVRARRDVAGWIVIAALGLFSCGLALITVAFVADTQGQMFAAMPWYMQVL